MCAEGVLDVTSGLTSLGRWQLGNVDSCLAACACVYVCGVRDWVAVDKGEGWLWRRIVAFMR